MASERPDCIPSLPSLWDAIAQEGRYYFWRSEFQRCLQRPDSGTLKQLMDEIVADLVATKLPFLRGNTHSLYGSPEVTRVAMQLSKDLALIFDTTAENSDLNELLLSTLQEGPGTDDPDHSDCHQGVTTSQWFLKVMGALTKAIIIDSASSSPPGCLHPPPRYLGCSGGGIAGGSVADIPAPLLNLLQHSSFENLHPPKRGGMVSDDTEPLRKRLKSLPKSGEIPIICPIENCVLGWNVKGRNSLIEHIEAHTQPYRCTISEQCNLTFSRISNLNRHRETKHSLMIGETRKLRTEDVIEEGEIHDRIRRFESLAQLRILLEALGFHCCDA